MDYDNLTSLPAMFFANTSEIGDRPFLWAKCGGDDDRPQGRMRKKATHRPPPGVTRRMKVNGWR